MKANYACDLHAHSIRSDGKDTVEEFIDNAVLRGMEVIAITDHDVAPPETIEVEGKLQDVVSYAKSKGVNLIKGIEISCETDIEDVHLVCFGCDWSDPYFDELSRFTIKSKIEGYKLLVERLKEDGIEIEWEEILTENGAPIPEEKIQKKMIFETIAQKGYTENWQQAKMMVKANRFYCINREKPDAVGVIRTIHELGGIAILAHPHLISAVSQYNGKTVSRKDFIKILIENGIDGIEASYTYDKTSYVGTCAPLQIKEKITKLCQANNLIISGGSDYHADLKKGTLNQRDMGECGITVEEFNQYELLKRLINVSL